MKNSFSVRLRPPMGYKGPAFGTDQRGEAVLVLLPEDEVPVFSEGSAFVQFGWDGAITLIDDGGNGLIPSPETLEGSPLVEKPALRTFLLGSYLCALTDGVGLISPDCNRAILHGGVDVLIALIPEGQRDQIPFQSMAQTRAVENSLFVIVAGGVDEVAVFAPGGALMAPVFFADGRGEILIERRDPL